MTKECYILRGVSGSGKSTHGFKLALEANQKGLTSAILSADDFFVLRGNGKYDFDPKLLGEAHKACFLGFVSAINREVDCVIVDNTNTTAVEIAGYERYATAMGYNVQIVTIACDPAIAAKRNTHGVPEKGVRAMHDRLMREISNMPPWWNKTTIQSGV
jgi:tRNA uridine 5-carbamoylmethylation protein Kti12